MPAWCPRGSTTAPCRSSAAARRWAPSCRPRRRCTPPQAGADGGAYKQKGVARLAGRAGRVRRRAAAPRERAGKLQRRQVRSAAPKQRPRPMSRLLPFVHRSCGMRAPGAAQPAFRLRRAAAKAPGVVPGTLAAPAVFGVVVDEAAEVGPVADAGKAADVGLVEVDELVVDLDPGGLPAAAHADQRRIGPLSRFSHGARLPAGRCRGR